MASPSSPSRLASPPPASRPADRLSTCQTKGSSMAASSSRPRPASPTPVEDEDYRVAPFPPKAGGREIMMRLLLLLQQYYSGGKTGVNAGLPMCDPWNIPGMPEEEEGNPREKYYVTDSSVLKTSSTNPATQTGYWKPRDHGWGVPGGEGIGPAHVNGLKTTYDFHIGGTIYQEGSKGTSWIMDVCFPINNDLVEDDLVMCHVFKGNSRDYDPRPRCAAHHHESPKEKEIHGQSNNSLLERPGGLLETQISSNKHLSPSHQQASMENGSLAQHQGSFQSANRIIFEGNTSSSTSLPNQNCYQNTGEPNHQASNMVTDDYMVFSATERPDLPLSPGLATIVEHLAATMENTGVETSMGKFSTPIVEELANTENTGVEISMAEMMIKNDVPTGGGSSRVAASAENGPLGKRARTKSPVWKKFKKLFTKAKVALAMCDHCYKVMTADSKKDGTSHLRRHKCHCNH